MKPYMIIEGNTQSLENFEKKVADALEMGYSLGGELVTHGSQSDIKLFQTMIIEDEMEDEEDDEDDEEFDDNDDE